MNQRQMCHSQSTTSTFRVVQSTSSLVRGLAVAHLPLVHELAALPLVRRACAANTATAQLAIRARTLSGDSLE